MANEKDIEKANQNAPAVDIPDLKKKEKERKKSGFAWGGAKPGATPFSGATGGSGVARAAASAANASASAAGAAAGGGSSFLGGLMATTLGKTLVMAGAAMFIGGGAMVGYSMLRGGQGGGGSMLGDLGGLSSGMKVRKGANDSTGWLASKGEITFDPKKKAEEPKKDGKAPADQTAAAPAADQTADAAGQIPEWKKDTMEHNLSGAKLSSSLGGAFGSKNIFGGAGNGAAPKFNDSLGKLGSLGQKGQLSKSRAAGVRSRVGQRSAGARLTSNRALGQLKIARGMSAIGAGANTADGARSGAAAAFDGATGANTLETGGGGGGMESGAPDTPEGTGGGMGGAAPDVTVDTPTGIALNDDTTAMLAAIGAMAKQAGKLKSMGTMLMILGAVLIAIAIMLEGSVFGSAIAVTLLLLGVALIAAGFAMMMIGDSMAAMAKDMGKQLAARTGDVNQSAIVNECTDQALDGTDPANCRVNEDLSHREHMNDMQQDNVQQHQQQEQENSAVQEEQQQQPANPTP